MEVRGCVADVTVRLQPATDPPGYSRSLLAEAEAASLRMPLIIMMFCGALVKVEAASLRMPLIIMFCGALVKVEAASHMLPLIIEFRCLLIKEAGGVPSSSRLLNALRGRWCMWDFSSGSRRPAASMDTTDVAG